MRSVHTFDAVHALLAGPALSRRPVALVATMLLAASAYADVTPMLGEPMVVGPTPTSTSPRISMDQPPPIVTGAGPVGPKLSARPGAQGPETTPQVDPATMAALNRLLRVAEPRSGYGSTVAAANAAWTLGLIYLHGGVTASSAAQAQTWFERATRYGKQPLAYAGLAWCYIDGCKESPNPAWARQAIAKLKPRYGPRATYLEWVLLSRQEPLQLGGTGPQSEVSYALPHRNLLLSAAASGDAQAQIELGMEAVARDETKQALSYFKAAAPRSRAAAADLQILERREGVVVNSKPSGNPDADLMLEQAHRLHRGAGVSANYAEAMRLYRAAAAKGSGEAKRMVELIMSKPAPGGTLNIPWMSQLAYLDTSSALPRFDTRQLMPLLTRDPTPLHDLMPAEWQRRSHLLIR